MKPNTFQIVLLIAAPIIAFYVRPEIGIAAALIELVLFALLGAFGGEYTIREE